MQMSSNQEYGENNYLIKRHKNHWFCGNGMHLEYHYEVIGANENHTTFNRVESNESTYNVLI